MFAGRFRVAAEELQDEARRGVRRELQFLPLGACAMGALCDMFHACRLLLLYAEKAGHENQRAMPRDTRRQGGRNNRQGNRHSVHSCNSNVRNYGAWYFNPACYDGDMHRPRHRADAHD